MDYGLVVPFLDESPAYAHGVELGMFYERIQSNDELNDIFSMANQEQITLILNRLGWEIIGMDDVDEFWFRLHARRTFA